MIPPVPSIIVAVRDEQIGHLHEESFADAVVGVVLAVSVATKPVLENVFEQLNVTYLNVCEEGFLRPLPGEPAHRWCHSEPVVKGAGEAGHREEGG